MNTIPGRALKNIVDAIIYQIDDKKLSINNRQLLQLCQKETDLFKTDTDPHIFHELAETALNKLIKEHYTEQLLRSPNPTYELKQILKPLCDRLPTQTWRSNNQIIHQQFSTPPQIAYFLSYLINFRTNEIVLEPSAGTGSLAVWASGFGLQVFANEIDPRRRAMLDFLGFESTKFNAEYIHDHLPPEIKPDVLIMNPPFSSSGGKTKNNSSKFGFRHVRSALERLKPGGKFGIILGNSAGLDTRTGRNFWKELSSFVNLKTVIKIDGREYYKYGTSVDTNLFIGTKCLKTPQKAGEAAINAINNISIESIEEGFDVAQSSNLRLD